MYVSYHTIEDKFTGEVKEVNYFFKEEYARKAEQAKAKSVQAHRTRMAQEQYLHDLEIGLRGIKRGYKAVFTR